MVGAERPGVAFLTCGLDCKLTIKNSIQRQHTAVTVARCNSTQRATSASSCSSCCIRSKVWQAYSASRIVALDPVFLTQSTLRYTGCWGVRQSSEVWLLIQLNITKGVWGTGPQEQGQKRKLENKKINFTNQDNRSKVELRKSEIKNLSNFKNAHWGNSTSCGAVLISFF